MTYPIEFRQHVLKVKEQETLTYAETAKRFRIGIASLMRWAKRIEPCRQRNKPAMRIDMQALEQDVQHYPDAYQYERASRLGVSKSCVWWALKRLKLSRKKDLGAPQSRRTS